MVRFSKFTLNIKIYEEFVEFLSKLVWREILFFVICLEFMWMLTWFGGKF